MQKFTQEIAFLIKNGGVEYRKSMFPHGRKRVASYYHLLMHRWSSRKHYIPGHLIIMGRQTMKTWSFTTKKAGKTGFFTPKN